MALSLYDDMVKALALAMKSDWVQAVSANEKARNIIALFTDASAHSYKKAQEWATTYYPDNMLGSLEYLKNAWEGSTSLGQDYMPNLYRMNQQAKRLIIYDPLDSYPWNEISMFPYVKFCPIEAAFGGEELDKEIILSDLTGAIR